MSKNLFLNTLLITIFISSSAFASATYRATGRAVGFNPATQLLLPGITAGADGTQFSLDYVIDETQIPVIPFSERSDWVVESFTGFIGPEIAISGTGALLSFSEEDLLFFYEANALPQSSLTLGGGASVLENASFGFSTKIPQAVTDASLTGNFPVEGATFDGDPADTDWGFVADEPFSGFDVAISGDVDRIVLLEGPAVDNMPNGGGGDDGMMGGDDGMMGGGDGMMGGDDGMMGGDDGMMGGGDGMMGGGDGMMGGDDGMMGGNGAGGAVPEPGSALIWITLLAAVAGFHKRRQNVRSN